MKKGHQFFCVSVALIAIGATVIAVAFYTRSLSSDIMQRLDIGAIDAPTDVYLVVWNQAASSVEVNTIKSGCGCVIVGSIPKQVDANSVSLIPLRAKAPIAGSSREVEVMFLGADMPPVTSTLIVHGN